MDGISLRRKGYSVAALRELARARLPRMVFDMVDGAAGARSAATLYPVRCSVATSIRRSTGRR